MMPSQLSNNNNSNSDLTLTSVSIGKLADTAKIRLTGTIQGVANGETSLWFEIPAELKQSIMLMADPFLPAMIIYGMHEQQDLTIIPKLSQELLRQARKLIQFYNYQTGLHGGKAMHRISIRTQNTGSCTRGSSSAAFFSGGVDSFYTLLKNLHRYPKGDPRRIQYLITVHGFDIPLDNTVLFDETVTYLTEIASKYDLTLLPVKTNLREMTNVADWTYFGFGPGLASVGLALQPMFHTIYVPASAFYAYRQPTPFFASHPSLDPLWSTESVEFVHDGIEARRIDKVELISKNDDALQALRVCWRNPDGKYNCGVCEKCLRTMVELSAFNALNKARHFPNEIDSRLIDNLKIAPHLTEFWEDSADALSTTDPALSKAIHQAIWRGTPILARFKRLLNTSF